MTGTPSSTLAFEPVPAVEPDRIRAAGFGEAGDVNGPGRRAAPSVHDDTASHIYH